MFMELNKRVFKSKGMTDSEEECNFMKQLELELMEEEKDLLVGKTKKAIG